VRADEEVEHPAEAPLSEAQRRSCDLVAADGDLPKLRAVVLPPVSGVEPVVERLGREVPVLTERLLVKPMKRRSSSSRR